jgi:hypothetical protein
MSPCVPAWAYRDVKVYAPYFPLARLANIAAERAWSHQGVRIYLWPCGHAAVVAVNTAADTKLLRECFAQLVGTWAKGARLGDVLADLKWARATA